MALLAAARTCPCLAAGAPRVRAHSARPARLGLGPRAVSGRRAPAWGARELRRRGRGARAANAAEPTEAEGYGAEAKAEEDGEGAENPEGAPEGAEAEGEAAGEEEEPEPEPPSFAPLLAQLEEAAEEGPWTELVPAVADEFFALQQRVDSNAASAAAFEETLNTTKEQYLRLNADFDNFRKRTAAEKEQIAERTRGQTVESLLPVIDTFESAKKNLTMDSEEAQKVDAAYQGVYKMMLESFKQLGVEEVATVGQPFDPEVHNAIMREETEEFDDGVVMEEFRSGFTIGDTLLRAAMVKVAVSASGAAAADGASEVKAEAEETA